MKIDEKRAQQEMVGFVLIVVIVVIGLVVFLIFSLNNVKTQENDIANNLMSTILGTSSRCALVFEPNYEDMRDLIKSSYEGRRCSNTNELAETVFEESIEEILDEVLILEPYITAYQFDYDHENDQGISNEFRIINGVCNGTVYSSEPTPIRINDRESLIATLKICIEED